MTLTLYNTLTRKKEPFRPIDPANVRMYVCGPTVYDYAHIGNARPVIVFDVLFRLLRHLYGADHVTYARNITDVDDKIIVRATEQYPQLSLNEAIRKVTTETEKQFHEDIRALGVLTPEDVNKPGEPPLFVEPRATEHIAEMRALIEVLVASKHAYVAQDHVLFDVTSMPDYGQLANRTLGEMEAGARVDVAPYKKGPMDFVLWKPSKPGEPAWVSPAGIAAKGRPGWHIECSAMADKWLWDEARSHLSAAGLARPHVFDIHGGGIDLVFPHHENEIAQSRSAHGTPAMANVWMHNGFLQVEGEKMSKSLGNFVTINEVLNTTNFGGRRWPGEIIRFAMLMTHYRQPIDWTVSRLQEAEMRRTRWLGPPVHRGIPEKGKISASMLEALADDLNTSEAFAALDELARRSRTPGEALPANMADDLAASMVWLGLALDEEFAEARADSEDLRNTIRAAMVGANKDAVAQAIAARNAARKAKNFKEADRIRDELSAMGIQLKDSKDHATGEIVTTWEVKR